MKESDEITPDEISIEKSLSHLKPMDVPEDWLSEIEDRLARESGEESVKIATGKTQTVQSPKPYPVDFRMFIWTAAAFLMIGVFVGWFAGRSFMTTGDSVISGMDSNSSKMDGFASSQNSNASIIEPFETVVRNQQLRKVNDDGIVLSIGETPMKRLRYEFVDTYVWEPASDGALMRMEVPREDFVLVPVSTY